MSIEELNERLIEEQAALIKLLKQRVQELEERLGIAQ